MVFQTQVGLYAQDQVRIDNWVLSFAGRYDWVETDVDDVASNTHAPERSRAFTGRAGIGYLFDNGLAPYLSYPTSFRAEAGIKYQPLGWNGLITASVF
ncbi:MAG: TonB-dependent receptor [Shinella sp.]|uniref:TonB-dependent receptor domain-containing protein n=1 Tax=Shinella sp. WSC3-e TaxID=3113208 RepID=UPI00234EDA0B|nr:MULTISPECIES: TonB-dependent receptor [unclassified Shinella]MCO5141177.1 TonB-dependent receptor [Shinella sp.]